MRNLSFDPDLFTRIFWELREADTRFVMNYGGAGSSKSWSQAQHEVIKALESQERILVIRKTAATLDDSVVHLMLHELLSSYGLSPLTTYNRSRKNLTLPNGSEILFRGIDDPEKIKSMQSISRIWVEEASELEERDFDQLNLRMRGIEGLQMTFTFNPISEHHWIKEKFFDTERRDVTKIHSTYRDNPFLDEEFHRQMEWYRNHDPDYFMVYGAGEWGRVQTGFEFYPSFSSELIKETSYDPEQPLHISWDFNVNPYMTLCVFQVEGQSIWQIDEMCLKPPHNNTEDVCEAFRRKYPRHANTVFVYGDPAGKQQDTRTKRGRNDYTIIRSKLKDYALQERVQPKPPEVNARGNFAKAVMEGWDGFSLVVDQDCRFSIEDFLYTKKEADGSKLKQRERDKKTGVSVERFGHTSDAFDYFLCSAFRSKYYEYLYGSAPTRSQRGTRRGIKTQTF